MKNFLKPIRHFILYCIGFRQVTLQGTHCGTCGKWINEPVTLFRYKGIVKFMDGWDLCHECITGAYEPKTN